MSISPEQERVLAIREGLQVRGYLIRMTEWYDGYQCCAFKRDDVRHKHVSGWHPTELAAWEEIFDVLVVKQEVSQAQRLGLVK